MDMQINLPWFKKLKNNFTQFWPLLKLVLPEFRPNNFSSLCKVVSATMPQNNFQNRIDFGVSAKSLSVEFIMGSTYSLALHGFAIQYRFQRNV